MVLYGGSSLREQPSQLVDGETPRNSLPAPALAHEVDRIGPDQLPSAGGFKKDVHEVSQIALCLRCQRQRLQPVFDFPGYESRSAEDRPTSAAANA